MTARITSAQSDAHEAEAPNGFVQKPPSLLTLLASHATRPGGLEPPTYWFEASHSIQLSYGREPSGSQTVVPEQLTLTATCAAPPPGLVGRSSGTLRGQIIWLGRRPSNFLFAACPPNGGWSFSLRGRFRRVRVGLVRPVAGLTMVANGCPCRWPGARRRVETCCRRVCSGSSRRPRSR